LIIACFDILHLFVIIVIWKEQMDSISDDDDVDSLEKLDIMEVRLGKHGHWRRSKFWRGLQSARRIAIEESGVLSSPRNMHVWKNIWT